MNDNLSEMIKKAEEPNVTSFGEADLELPNEEEKEEEEVTAEADADPGPVGGETEATEEVTAVLKAKVTNLHDWFKTNSGNFEDIRQIKIGASGVNPERYLVLTVPDLSGEKDADGNPIRELRKYDDAHLHPVLDLPSRHMKAFSSGFVIYYELGNDVVVKTYGVRTGLILVACYNLEGVGLIPYDIRRVKRKDTEIDIPLSNGEGLNELLNQPVDKEALQLRYKQSGKFVDEFTTTRDAVKWLLERQDEMFDINHLFQIDGVLIDTLR
jgi:hypothetical protein